MSFLIDTNICILHIKKKLSIYLERDPLRTLYVSEITVAELLVGAACSEKKEENTKQIDEFLVEILVLRIERVLPRFAMEKARLRRTGRIVEDFDILLAATALHFDLTMATNNVKHFDRYPGLRIEDSSKPSS